MTADGINYSQNRYNYDYLPNFAVAPTLLLRSILPGPHSSPRGDDTLINLAGRFTCGGLSLYP